MSVTVTFGNGNGTTYTSQSTASITTGTGNTAAKIAFSKASLMTLSSIGQAKADRFQIGTLTVGDTYINFDCNNGDPFNGLVTFYLIPTSTPPELTFTGFEASGGTITVKWDVTHGQPGTTTVDDDNTVVQLTNYKNDFTPDP